MSNLKKTAFRQYKKLIETNASLRDKIYSGSICSSKEQSQMYNRFYSENAGLIAEARKEQAALKKKKVFTCLDCGGKKSPQFTFCYKCNENRKHTTP